MGSAVRSVTTLATGTRTNSSFTAPAGITDGDILLLLMSCGATTGPPAVTLSGFSVVTGFPGNINKADPFTRDLVALWKLASGESGSYTTSHASANTDGILYAISGADGTTPFNPAATIANGTGPTTTATGLSTNRDSSLVIFAGIAWDGWTATATPPTGTTPTFALRFSGGTSGSFVAFDGPMTTHGPTGNKSATCINAVGNPWCVVLIAVDAAAAGGGTVGAPYHYRHLAGGGSF